MENSNILHLIEKHWNLINSKIDHTKSRIHFLVEDYDKICQQKIILSLLNFLEDAGEPVAVVYI